MSALQAKRLARHMIQHSHWDEESQVLWLDYRKLLPKLDVVAIKSWDAMMLSAEPIPNYASEVNPLNWQAAPAVKSWLKQIPQWIVESCMLFPSQQMRLLHFCGRYPQMIELLDHSPILAWRLVASALSEAEIVALLADKRTQQVEQIGWPGKAETVKFLRNLRLRQVNDEINQQIEVCVLDDQRLNALQALPRVNSMALSLAARFPEMIGCRLHHALAAMPCRPMQCQSMIALLEDAYRLASFMALEAAEVQKIADSRYLIEVEQLYQAWLKQALANEQRPDLVNFSPVSLGKTPQKMTRSGDWIALSAQQKHAWFTDLDEKHALFAFQSSEESVVFLLDEQRKLVRVRQNGNLLPSAEALSQIHLWLATFNG